MPFNRNGVSHSKKQIPNKIISKNQIPNKTIWDKSYLIKLYVQCKY